MASWGQVHDISQKLPCRCIHLLQYQYQGEILKVVSGTLCVLMGEIPHWELVSRVPSICAGDVVIITGSCSAPIKHGIKIKNSLPPVNWRWVEEGDGYVGRLQPPGQPLGVGLPSGLQCMVPYPYRRVDMQYAGCVQPAVEWAIPPPGALAATWSS
jgi:hypothetical protein